MFKVGLPLSLIGAFMSGVFIHFFGGFASTFDIWNSCPNYVSPSALCRTVTGQDYPDLQTTSPGFLEVNVTLP